MGTYRVRVYQPGKSDFAGAFEVQSYQLEPIDLSFDLKKTVFYRGETVEADVVAKYQYGAPVAGRPIEVTLPDQRVLNATTDATGKFHVSFSTDGFAEEQALSLTARLPQDNVATRGGRDAGDPRLRHRRQTSRDVFQDGESFAVQIATTDARGEPTGQTLSAAVDQAGQPGGPGHRARSRSGRRSRPIPRQGKGRSPSGSTTRREATTWSACPEPISSTTRS